MADGAGYLQSKFLATCSGCSFAINKEKLAVFKFARNLVLDPKNEKDTLEYHHGIYLACVFCKSRYGPVVILLTTLRQRYG